jgi:signal recognition particle subunit SRP68
MDVERMNPDLSLFKKLNFQETITRAIRCFFVACLYFSNYKYQETVSLLSHNQSLVDVALERVKEVIITILAFIYI